MTRAVILAAAIAIVAALPASADPAPCSSGAVVVALQDGGPTPVAATVQPGQAVDVVNQTASSLTVTGPDGAASPLGAGGCVALPGSAVDYTYTVGGYPAGVVTGTVRVVAPASVTIAPHVAILYGAKAVLSGTASGAAGTRVVVYAQPVGSPAQKRIASLAPASGVWHLDVAPTAGTLYTATFGSASVQRVLSVQPILKATRRRGTITARVEPAAIRLTVQLFRYTPARSMPWTAVRTARADGAGVATFRKVPAGRYYVSALGGTLYQDTATEPFNIHG